MLVLRFVYGMHVCKKVKALFSMQPKYIRLAKADGVELRNASGETSRAMCPELRKVIGLIKPA